METVWLEFSNHNGDMSRIKLPLGKTYRKKNILLENSQFSIYRRVGRLGHPGSLRLRIKDESKAESLSSFLEEFVRQWGGDPDTLKWRVER